MLIKTNGTMNVFRAYGVLCLAFLVLFVIVNMAQRDEGMSGEAAPEGDIVSANLDRSTLPDFQRSKMASFLMKLCNFKH
jgi:hypothetical protein